MIRLDKTLAEVAELVKGKVVGNRNLTIKGLSGIKEAKEGDLTFLANPKYTPLARETKASAILASTNLQLPGKSLVLVENPSLAFAKIIESVLKPQQFLTKGIHPTAIIAESVRLGKNVAVGAHVVIEAKVSIGDNTVIQAGCFIGHETKIGNGCHIYPNVTIRERIIIGNRVIIHSGTVIGSDGFGFEAVDGVHTKIPQIGTVIIEDDVEIGANVTIDRARFDKTFIGKGTKIDNLVQIGHNVIIGENCIIVALVGIAGSVEIKKGVILAGQSGVSGHLTIGEGVIVGAKSGVMKSIPAHTKVSGFPARPIEEELRVQAGLKRLPVYVKKIQELTRKVEELEKKLKHGKKKNH
ncbi:MAG TPA: UDP-3-O-(3-hydroxymyristoyl)glucosamine N-acyltransferase [Candidatus Omnitrophota bacterium]|nr:UDP-3-O-(3-hydroxymyristoyl)glucosamine N-acyltransferase [Candidatus Omnitrophota bacterium]